MPQHSTAFTDDELANLRKKHVCVTASGAARIEVATRRQGGRAAWRDLRKIRLTSSNFGAVVRRRKEL